MIPTQKLLYRLILLLLNPLTPGAFCKKVHFLDILVIFKLDLGQITFNPVENAFATRVWAWPTSLGFSIFGFFFAFPFSSFPFFLLQWLTFYWACLQLKNFWKSVIKTAIFSMEQWREILLWVFRSTFWAFLCISKAPFGRSLCSGHHWKDLFLLQKLSIDGANFGQKWWRQKRKKGQGSPKWLQAAQASMG